MYKIFMKAKAKINLTLDVIRKREDGYHEVKMIMQRVNLADDVFIRKMKAKGIRIKTNLPWVPKDERNLVYKVIKKMKELYNIEQGLFVEIKKVIPVSAGLGGGSADAAITIIAMNKLFNLGLSTEEMMEIGKEFGADIPYCILTETALAEGIGEELKIINKVPEMYVVLSRPEIIVSTKEVYKNLDLKNIRKHPQTEDMINAIEDKDVKQIGSLLYNVLEEYTADKYPVIKEIEKVLMNNNALGACMSGSGATVFGLFDNKKDAARAKQELKYKMNIKETFLTTTV